MAILQNMGLVSINLTVIKHMSQGFTSVLVTVTMDSWGSGMSACVYGGC